MFIFQIRVNSVNPTFVTETGMADQGLGNLTPDELKAKTDRIPLGKYPGMINSNIGCSHDDDNKICCEHMGILSSNSLHIHLDCVSRTGIECILVRFLCILGHCLAYAPLF